jgi:ribonucleoside-diphosphate reductase alpha chain
VPQAILKQAFDVIEAWGFDYRSGAVWEKTDGIGEGHYFRNLHEHVLLAKRGDFPPPPPSARLPSIIRAPRCERHSEKPDELYEAVEHMYPTLSRLELFARRAAGLDVLGQRDSARAIRGGRRMTRERLPNRRASETFAFECNGLRYVATVSRYPNGDLAEIFIGNAKAGSHSDAVAKDAAVVCSPALQHGVPVETIRHALLRDTRGNPCSPLGVALDLLGGEP